jgi:hypothetical protein
MVSRAIKRATAHQVFKELMEGEFSAKEGMAGLSRKDRRALAWTRAKMIAKSMVKYAEDQENQRSTAQATLIKSSDIVEKEEQSNVND